MDKTTQFNQSIATINSLSASPYEKDLIRSAYYNHLNSIPISQEAVLVLKKYGITFSHANVRVDSKQNAIESRKNQYKASLQAKRTNSNTHAETTPNGIYTLNLKQPSQASIKQSQTLLQILNEAETIFSDSQKLLTQCQEILEICFSKQELSYSMIYNIINKSSNNIQNTRNALNEFLQPFLELFESLATPSQQEILKKIQVFMEKLQAEKTISADLCIKLSAIRAQNTLKKENDFIDYLQTTIKKLDNYIQN